MRVGGEDDDELTDDTMGGFRYCISYGTIRNFRKLNQLNLLTYYEICIVGYVVAIEATRTMIMMMVIKYDDDKIDSAWEEEFSLTISQQC